MIRPKTNYLLSCPGIIMLFITALFITAYDKSLSSQNSIKTKIVGGIEFIHVPGGIFMMGSPDDVGETDEHPQHKVNIKSFWMGKYEVTQKQFQSIMGFNTSVNNGDKFPVGNVSRDNILEFCNKFKKKFGVEIRLPYEAEWEYACRAGTTTAYYWGDQLDGKYCWYQDNSENNPHPVGMKLPNAWGFYDMIGNVKELCMDTYAAYSDSEDQYPKEATDIKSSGDSVYVNRGGSYTASIFKGCCKKFLRSAARGKYYYQIGGTNNSQDMGFRIVLLGEGTIDVNAVKSWQKNECIKNCCKLATPQVIKCQEKCNSEDCRSACSDSIEKLSASCFKKCNLTKKEADEAWCGR